MAMPGPEIIAMIKDGIEDADIELIDLAGDNDHWKAIVKSPAFCGKSRVQQHQMVYAALKGHMGGTLHALALETHCTEKG